MADSASESHCKSDALGAKHISSSFFNLHGFFVGFGSRGSTDSESVRSPTSPLDFSFFSNLSKPFSKSPRSPTQNRHQKKWDDSKVGLGIINLLADETKPTGEVLNSPKRKNIIFGSQVKTSYFVRSNSLPRNYMLLLLPQTKTPNLELGKSDSDAVFGNDGLQSEPKPFEISSPISLSPKSPLSSKKICSENRTTSITKLSFSGRGPQTDNSLEIKSSSLPVSVGSSQGYVGSLSACEIELSEDYTCIISYGPNPKTTHIFGDCILECHTNELSNFDKTEILGSELPQEAKCPGGSTTYPSNEFLSFCCSCKKKLEKGDDINIYRGEKAFCSFDCQSKDIFAEGETEKTYSNSPKSSPESSYHEDVFPSGIPIAI